MRHQTRLLLFAAATSVLALAGLILLLQGQTLAGALVIGFVLVMVVRFVRRRDEPPPGEREPPGPDGVRKWAAGFGVTGAASVCGGIWAALTGDPAGSVWLCALGAALAFLAVLTWRMARLMDALAESVAGPVSLVCGGRSPGLEGFVREPPIAVVVAAGRVFYAERRIRQDGPLLVREATRAWLPETGTPGQIILASDDETKHVAALHPACVLRLLHQIAERDKQRPEGNPP